MSSYTSVFGGQTINPTMLSYAAYTTAVDLSLVWSFEALDGSDVMAAKLDVIASVAALSVAFPKASLVSVGQDVLIRNTGANLFSVHDYAGNTLGTVASGESWYFYLTDNSTDAGTWESVQFGTGTSSASAASLAGYGLAAVTTLLNQNLPTTALTGDYTFGVSDTARVVRSSGGVVVWAFASAATLGSGWFAYVINAGSGTLTLNPAGAETIDSAATKVIQPDESCIVFCDGVQFSTVGYGRAITSTVTAQSIGIAGGPSTVTLSAVQNAAQIQNFTGALTGNQIVDYGSGPGYWFIYNNTTGAYTVTFRAGALDAGVVVTQGAFSIIRSDGPNMKVAFTATSGTVTNVATGTGLTGGPITTTGTVALANTAVTPGTYGGALNMTVGITVDAQGRITNAGDGNIAIPLTQVTAFSSATLRGQLTDETGSGVAVFGTSPTIGTPIITNPTVTTGTFTSPSIITPTIIVGTFTGTLTMSGAAINNAARVDVASATTCAIGAAASNYVRITGTTTITGMGTVASGIYRDVVFGDALTLTYNITSLILPTAANITTAAGDTAGFVSDGSGNWRCLWYQRANGQPVAANVGFLANKNNVDQTLSDETWTKLTFGTETFDNGGYYDISTSRWTPSAGTYLINGRWGTSAFGLANVGSIGIYVNGSRVYSNTIADANGLRDFTVAITQIMALNGTDYVELWGYVNTAGASQDIDGAAEFTTFSGSRLP